MDRARLRPVGETLGGVLVKPAVTVLMPVYNTPGNLLDQAIGSVLAQTFPDFELLIVDDGSADPSTHDSLQRAVRQDPRVRVSQPDPSRPHAVA